MSKQNSRKVQQHIAVQRALVEIVQPIGGIQDYAYASPEREGPMATKRTGNGHAMVGAVLVGLVVVILILAMVG